jgi:hypothetical protein
MENEEKTWTHIHFDLSVVDFVAIRKIMEDLRWKGVTFDSGGTREVYEWHTDWSLEGPMSVRDLTDLLDEKGIAHTTVKTLEPIDNHD